MAGSHGAGLVTWRLFGSLSRHCDVVAEIPAAGDPILFVLGLPLERTVWEPLCTSLSCVRTRQSIETDCQWENSPGGIAGVLPAVKARPGSTPGPGDIDVPKAVIAGRDDQPIPLESSRRIAAAISGAQLDVIPHVVV